MSVLLDHYRSVQGMEIPNKGSGTTSQPTSVGFSGYVNATGPSESYGIGDEYRKGTTGKSTAPLQSAISGSSGYEIPSNLNTARSYAGLGVATTGAISKLLQAAGSYYGNETAGSIGSGLSKAAYGAGVALDVYDIASGIGGAKPYVGLASKAGSLASNYLAQQGPEALRYIGGAMSKALPAASSIYNIATGKGQGGDYLSVGGSAASTVGGLTGSSALSGIGSAVSSYVAPYYALAKAGGTVINAITDKNQKLKETPFGRLGESLSEPLAVEQYWGNELADYGVGNRKINAQIAQGLNPVGNVMLALNKGDWKDVGMSLGNILTGGPLSQLTRNIGKAIYGSRKPAQTPAQLMAAYKWAQENPELNKKMVDEILAKQKGQEMIKVNQYI